MNTEQHVEGVNSSRRRPAFLTDHLVDELFHLFDLVLNHVEQIRTASQLMYGAASRPAWPGAHKQRQATSTYFFSTRHLSSA